MRQEQKMNFIADDLEMKTLDDHTPECKWHKDWHACDCGAFDK